MDVEVLRKAIAEAPVIGSRSEKRSDESFRPVAVGCSGSFAKERVRRMAKIISVHSYRGGTGKSNLTANLATLLAMSGKRVGVVDTDIQSPGIHVIFGLDEGHMTRSLNDYLWGQCGIEETAYDVSPGDVHQRGGMVYLIPSSIKAGEIARIIKEGYGVEDLTDGFYTLLERCASTTCSSTRTLASTRRRCIRWPSRTCWS